MRTTDCSQNYSESNLKPEQGESDFLVDGSCSLRGNAIPEVFKKLRTRSVNRIKPLTEMNFLFGRTLDLPDTFLFQGSPVTPVP